MESKRLGRILPAVINGLSAAQAQSQGLVEVPSDADTASVANSETLFIGESDDESTSSRSRSGSPQNVRDANGQATQLDPAATPFGPNSFTPAGPARPNPFPAVTTFGKPSGTHNQANPTPVFGFSSESTNQAAPNPVEGKDPSKFNFFPSGKGTKVEEPKVSAGVFGSKELPKNSFFTSKLVPTTGENINGPVSSSFAPPIDKKPTFGRPSTTYSNTMNLGATEAIAENPSTSDGAAVSSEPRGFFDQPVAPSVPHVSSFGTSPLFEAARAESESGHEKANPSENPEERACIVSAPQQEHVAIKPPTFTPPSTTPSTPFKLLPTSNPLTKEANLPPAAPAKYSANDDVLNPKLEPQPKPIPEPSSMFPPSSSTTFAPPFSPTSSKSSGVIQSPNRPLEPTSFNPRAFPGSEFQPSSGQSTSAPSHLDPRSVALDKLSEIILLEDNGILQQFIEFTVGPIIKASIAQFEDESSWKEASQSSPFESPCGEQMLIGNRGMSCSLVGQEILQEVEV